MALAMVELTNAVLQLRQQRLAHTTRPFRARGSRVIRCQNCLLVKKFCICAQITQQSANCQFCLIMYDTEPLKPSNTGRLIADILPDTSAFLWSRVTPNVRLLTLLTDPVYQPYLIFPAPADMRSRVVTHIEQSKGKRPLFIILDGTWPEANKMFRKSPYLHDLPILTLSLTDVTDYQLRIAPKQQQCCTAEVAIQLLRKNNDQLAAQQLASHFDRFKQHYIAGKMNNFNILL